MTDIANSKRGRLKLPRRLSKQAWTQLDSALPEFQLQGKWRSAMRQLTCYVKGLLAMTSDGEKRLRPHPNEIDEFDMKSDDFSFQVTSKHDPLFWIRVEKKNDQSVVISDLKRSRIQLAQVVSGLELALSAARPDGNVNHLTFLDIAPSGNDEAASNETAILEQIVAEFAKGRGKSVQSIVCSRRGGKTDLKATLSNR